MKITIEGDPKEIAAYELALKDGKKPEISNCFEEAKQRALKRADACLSQGPKKIRGAKISF